VKAKTSPHDSGHLLFGHIPAHWQTKRLRFACEMIQTGGTPSQDFLDNADETTVNWFTPGDFTESLELDESGRKVSEDGVRAGEVRIFPSGTVFVVGIGATLGRVGFTRNAASANQQVNALIPRQDTHTAFLALQLSVCGDLMNAWANRSTLPILNQQRMGDIPIILPPFPEQVAIADFLDRETAKIDALVAVKEQVLGLLGEKRRALIRRAVTRGLDPKVPLRGSGLPWLGQIPKHWETERARWLFQERDKRSQSGDEELLTVSHLTGVTPRSEKNVNMFEAETTEGYKICQSGDLVINTLWAWMGAMGVSPLDGIVSPAYNVYTPCEGLDPAYVDALVRMPAFAQEATRFSKGVWSSRLRLYPEGFFEIWMPVPPLEEQHAIVAHIARETAKLDALRAAAERTIGLLKERRAALIAAAVTGQIEVKEVN
jgi:type I restriction enzyme, S subunit